MANEQKKGIYELNLDSDVFLGLKTDFNKNAFKYGEQTQ